LPITSVFESIMSMGHGQNHVAIVDDDDGVRRALARLLRAAGFDPEGFASAEAMLGDRRLERFACAVVDIRLGGMTGLDLARRLRLVAPGLGVVFITAEDTPANQDEAWEIGCAGYFGKPFDGRQLLEAVRRSITALARDPS
jgi:FixJ family two-component response regulator